MGSITQQLCDDLSLGGVDKLSVNNCPDIRGVRNQFAGPEGNAAFEYINFTEIYGYPEDLIRNRKPEMVEILRTLGVRSTQSLRKHTVILMLWLGIKDTGVGKLFEWIIDYLTSPIRADKLRYVILFLYKDIMEEFNLTDIPKIHNRYYFNKGESFRNVESMNKLSFTFCLYVWHAFKLTETPEMRTQNTNRRVDARRRKERMATFNRNFIHKALQIINTSGLPADTPSRSPRPNQRVRAGRTFTHLQGNNSIRRVNNRPPAAERPVIVPLEIIPKHIIDDFIKMYIQLNLETKDCPICLQNIKGNDLMITPCGHFFHKNCISKIRNNTCPTCRKIL